MVTALGHDGHTGYGETTANAYYGQTLLALMKSLESVEGFIRDYYLEDPGAFWKELALRMGPDYFALCAMDLAAWGLFGKMKGFRQFEYWGRDPARNPLADFTIGLDSIENMVAKLREFPWPVYKIKLGTPQDFEILEELRRWTDSPFRVDADHTWTAEQTIRNAASMKKLGVEFIEQPLPASQDQEMESVYRHSALPLLADESSMFPGDIPNCRSRFHGINIKRTKCGGLSPAGDMIGQAREAGMQVMVGSINERTIGTSAAAQLLPFLDYADLDGPLLLASDTGEGIRIRCGEIQYSPAPGTGAWLTRFNLVT